MGSSAEPVDEVRFSVPGRLLAVTGTAMVLGTVVGGMRGARLAGMRFLAENAHRPPRTVRGWYLYNKSKNYKMVLAGLREAGVQSSKLGFLALAWGTIDEALGRTAFEGVREAGAGLGTAALFAGVCE
ncbi:hypothetical protein K488DRAFT_50811 [Vararia minispora EC-137]|uniref:Uncharacterized protein n=1 Tax=Vararia minispora EC-137 TaxID=1314806 RepID=A0ACB8QJQ4_9AGAM|nr:hypothetical protein K488DRAFT_50811 [Vararia minispora EC-137]